MKHLVYYSTRRESVSSVTSQTFGGYLLVHYRLNDIKSSK